MYFNKRYDRVGPLFQSTYKATNVINKDYLLDITRYIHRNPYKYLGDITQAYSSYAHYLNIFNLPWVKKDEVLTYFNKSGFIKFNKIKNYKYFVETFKYKDETIDLSKEPEGLHPAS